MSKRTNVSITNIFTMKCYNCTLSVYNNGNMVEGDGTYTSRIMIIGEAPGFKEQHYLMPFIGKAGRYLKNVLNETGFNTSDIYFTNVVKCRPPQNRTPTDKEISTCKSYLFAEIRRIKPRYIICVGATASKVFIADFTTMASAIKHPIVAKNFTILFQYHPSYILRNDELREEYSDSWQSINSFYIK